MDGAKSSSISKQQEHEMDGGKPEPTTSEQQIDDRTTPAPEEEEEDDADSFDEWDNRMFGDSVEEEEDETGESISKRQIGRLCKDLSSMLDYLRLDIEPAAPLRGTMVGEDDDDDDGNSTAAPIIPSLLEQFKDLRRRMHKLRSRLFPFKEWHEEEQAKPVSYEGLDEEEKARRMMKDEEEFFDSYRQGTEFSSPRVTFTDETTLSPMHFTHCTPGLPLPYNAITETSLQVYSFKISEIRCNLRWPLHVYGVVAARDNSDRKRNIIFKRWRHECQELTADDPFLRLTGPSRAIMALSPVDFEVQLKLKGAGRECEDRALMNSREQYLERTCDGSLETLTFENCLCTAELSMEELLSSVQATFLGVRVVGAGPCPFKHGGRVACSSPIHEVVVMDHQGIAGEVIDPQSTQVVLLDSHHCHCGRMPMSQDGYLDLSRRSVSVKLQHEKSFCQRFKENLKVVFQAYSESGGIAAQGHVKVTPQTCNISQHLCDLGDSKVEITIAWSAILLKA